MTRFAAKTIAALVFCLSLTFGCSLQAGQYDYMSDDEYYFLLSIGAIKEEPVPPPQVVTQTQLQASPSPRTTGIQGLSGTDLGSTRIKGLSGTDLGSTR